MIRAVSLYPQNTFQLSIGIYVISATDTNREDRMGNGVHLYVNLGKSPMPIPAVALTIENGLEARTRKSL